MLKTPCIREGNDMSSEGHSVHYGIEQHGIKNVGRVFGTPSTPVLYEEIVRRREGLISHLGPIVVRTGHYTGRSPNDKQIVREASSEEKIWWGSVNVPMEPTKFDMLHSRLLAYLQGRDLFIQDCFVGADPVRRIPIHIITEYAWHSLFARNMFIQIKERSQLINHIPQFTVINTPRFHALPEPDGTNSEAYIIVNFGKRLILIGGTSFPRYSGVRPKGFRAFPEEKLTFVRTIRFRSARKEGSACFIYRQLFLS